MIDPREAVEWLVRGAPGAQGPQQVIAGVCRRLRDAGVRLDRMETFVRTLHPSIVGRSFVWTPEAPDVAVREQSWAYLHSDEYLASAMSECCRTSAAVRTRLDERSGDPALASLAREGFRDFVALPMVFLSGQNHPITFATKAEDGFRPDEAAALEAIMAPLARIGEILALLRTATNLLSTYVGRNAGARILSGQIQLGDTDTLKAIIWFSDLRGFTALTRSSPPQSVIKALNDLFGCQIPAIERAGGEVLKFIGDGLLAIFPYDDAAGPPRAACDAAVAAALQSLDSLEARNAARTAAGDPPIAFGVALHLGEVSYGNIGGESRLDFTCIGPAVNLASRLESVAAKSGVPVVVSEHVAALCSQPLEPLGSFELKGVDAPQQAFAVRRNPPASR